MKTYFLIDKGLFTKKQLESLRTTSPIFLTPKSDYIKTIQNDPSDKNIVYDPDLFGWKFPNDILNASKIKTIFLATTTADYIDEKLCAQKGISIKTISKYSTQSVAEYMVMLMFALAKKIPLQMKNGFKQTFTTDMTQMELGGKTVGIVGMGNIGTRFAELCAGLGMNVSYYNRTPRDTKFTAKPIAQIFKSDVVFVALATNDETKKIVTDKLLKSMSPNAILLSVGGNQLFNHALALEMCARGELFGYGLEIANPQPQKYAGNVMVTSEYAWFTHESQTARIEILTRNICGS